MPESAKKTTAPANPSLQKKSAARVAAVQCLYTQSFHERKQSPEKQVEILKARLKNNENEQKLVVGKSIEPNYKLVESLLAGIDENLDEVNHRLQGTISEKWSQERMSPVLVAILQCAIYELFFGKEISTKIVIDEYTKLSRMFFSDAEVDFVYGALSALVQRYHQ
jgi:transcription antitermination factor NusB